MSNYDKKRIIDRMFGFSILNDMQYSIKEERKHLRNDIDSFDSELSQINENIMSVTMKLNSLQSESDANNKKKIEELKQTLIDLADDRKKLEDVRTTISGKISDNNKELQNNQETYSNLKFKLNALEEKLKLYESNFCPACESKLTTDFHKGRKSEINESIDKIPIQIKNAEESVKEIKIKIKELREKDGKVRDKVSTINTNIENFKTEILSLKTPSAKKDFTHLNQIVKDFEKSSLQKENDRNELNADYSFLEVLENILGEDGIKNMAIKTILPVLNTNIAAMMQTMHLHFQIRFDDKFNCIVNHLGEEINPLTLSTGERKKADFIVIIALIKLLKLRFPQLNLLFLDELLSSVDADGIHNILKILGQVIKENKINTFVINHSSLPHELFDKKIQIYKENGFSKFDIETIE